MGLAAKRNPQVTYEPQCLPTLTNQRRCLVFLPAYLPLLRWLAGGSVAHESP